MNKVIKIGTAILQVIIFRDNLFLLRDLSAMEMLILTSPYKYKIIFHIDIDLCTYLVCVLQLFLS